METLTEAIVRNLETKPKEKFRPSLQSWALAKNPRRLKLALDLVDLYPDIHAMNQLEMKYKESF